MKQTENLPKVANDMLWAQLNWTFGFLGVMVVIHIFRIVSMIFFGGNDVDGYYMSVFIAANIFMFVIGIISIYFLPHYVHHGVPRKDYYKGTVLASIGLAVLIPMITLVLSLVDRFILVNMAGIQLADTDINSVITEIESGISASDIVGNIVSHTVQVFILTPYVDPGSHWLLAISVFSLTIFVYYLLGWFVSASFYRFGLGVGLGSILMAIIFLTLKDALLRTALDLPVSGWFAGLDVLPLSITLPSLLLIILVTMWLIRLLTERVPIKM